jgi:hypothetical protein
MDGGQVAMNGVSGLPVMPRWFPFLFLVPRGYCHGMFISISKIGAMGHGGSLLDD